MVKKFEVGDVLSESSHYKVVSTLSNSIVLKHQESGEDVYISSAYIEKHLNSADEVIEEIKVTKEDKKDGTLGIRSIFESIHSPQVFTVCFKKQDKPKSAKALKIETDERANRFAEAIDKVKSQKKGVAEAAKFFIEELVKHPILPYEEGDDRTLRGYKIQFESRDGRYNCIDMDIQEESNIRPVNINSIKWLILNRVKYIVS